MTEKQLIEEIETIIKSNLAEGSFANAFARKVAIQIVEQYQPKLSEDSVVLTREELAKERELNRKIDREFVISEFNVQIKESIKKAYNQARKETAREILQELKERVNAIPHLYFNSYETLCEIDKLAKQYGVEIEQ